MLVVQVQSAPTAKPERGDGSSEGIEIPFNWSNLHCLVIFSRHICELIAAVLCLNNIFFNA